MNTWRAGCGGSRLSGSEGGPGKPTSRKAGRAPWSDPYTYIKTWEGWAYLATVIDLYSRKVVGYAIADHMRTDLITDALDMAVTARHPGPRQSRF
jgi:putative transposase